MGVIRVTLGCAFLLDFRLTLFPGTIAAEIRTFGFLFVLNYVVKQCRMCVKLNLAQGTTMAWTGI